MIYNNDDSYDIDIPLIKGVVCHRCLFSMISGTSSSDIDDIMISDSE